MLPRDGRMHYSNLKMFDISPADYALSCESDRSSKKYEDLGTAIHGIILEDRIPIVYDSIRRGKAWDDFQENNQDTQIVSPSEMRIIEGCHKSFTQNKLAVELLSRCHTKEKQILWERDGIPFAGTPDAFGDDILAEIKSAESVNARKFLYAASRYNYHAQLANYDIGLGTKYEPFATKWREQYIIAIQTSAPYPCVVFQLEDLRIDQGNTKIEEWIAKYKECASAGFWPSYAPEQPVHWDGEIIINEED